MISVVDTYDLAGISISVSVVVAFMVSLCPATEIRPAFPDVVRASEVIGFR
jgi:hypothetical protein